MRCEAFVTGSHAYGAPHAESDVDLVVRATQATANKLLVSLFAADEGKDYGEGSLCFRAGSLNVIVCLTDERFASWLEGTKALMSLGRPVSRDEAVDHFKGLFAKEPTND